MTSIAATAHDAVLTLDRITKRFGSTVALDDVSLICRSGRVHALLGENGAGKTTLMRIAFGLIAPDAGQAMAGDRPVRSASDAIAAGIGMVHQHFTNVPAMGVAENVALGEHGRFDAERAAKRVDEIGSRTGLVLDPHRVAGELSVGAQQRLEIVKALARNARTLILDEPTAVLAPREIEELLAWLRHFADAGNAVVLITHKLREALAIADDVTVLRRGSVVLSGAANAVTLDSVSAALLGGEIELVASSGHEQIHGEPVAALDAASFVDARGVTLLDRATLEVRAGEIVGVAAIEGAGQHELLRLLAGRARATTGAVRLPDAIGFIPEDRHGDAMMLDSSATENVTLRGANRRRGRIDWRAQRAHTARLLLEHDVRGGDDRTAARALSGGNQQKLVLARELDGNPPLVVAENPTRGLDIRATRAVHERLRAAADMNAAVVVYSSDLDEVLSLATRIVVVHAGHVRECPLDRDVVGRAMLGVA
ncbi:MAG TPA: ATP-binding cassette domain-containing protein [Gemmatimonadaceae bacterium]